MRRHEPNGRNRAILASGLTAGALCLVGIWQWNGTNTVPGDAGDSKLASSHPNESPTAALAEAEHEIVERTPVLPETTEAAPTKMRTFEQWVQHLVDLGETGWAEFQDGDEASAAETDSEARAQLAKLRSSILRTDELALHAMFDLTPNDESIRGGVHRSVLAKLVEMGLHDRFEIAEYGGSRAKSDELVSAMLAAVPANQTLASDLGSRLLVGNPYLGLAHENAVLGIVELAVEQKFLTKVAEGLLRTLWKNLEATGARTSSHVSSLALLFLESHNESERKAALAHLLTSEGGRYQSVVLEALRRTGDSGLARHAADIAAADLEPARGLALITELAPLTASDPQGHVLSGPIVTLAQRDPDALRMSYAQNLADGADPLMRAALVTGIGFETGDTQLAESALLSDPAPDVRECAIFVLTAKAEPAVAERALLHAIQDASFSESGGRLASIVFSLDNLKRNGGGDEARRIALQLRGDSRIDQASAKHLDELLEADD